MSDLRHFQREFLSDFIEIYKNNPCLWKIKSKDYSDRNKKRDAYEVILKKYQQFQPDATRETICKKINSLRTIYRRELAKVISSQRSGAGEDDVYTPNLWYFEKLSFLKDQELPRTSISNLDEETDIADENVENTIEGEAGCSNSNPASTSTIHDEGPRSPATSPLNTPKTSSTSHVIRRRKRQNCSQPDKTTEILQLIGEKLRTQHHDDSYEIFAKHIANKLRRLDETQNVIAQKLISDVLFDAEMQKLTTDCRVVDCNDRGKYYTGQTMAPSGYGHYQGVNNFHQTMPQGVIHFQQPMPQQGVTNYYHQPMPQSKTNFMPMPQQGENVKNIQLKDAQPDAVKQSSFPCDTQHTLANFFKEFEDINED